MPEVTNTLDHPVRVRDENGALVRLVPGEVRSVEGYVADQLLALNGIETATDEQRSAWEEEAARRSGAADPEDSPTLNERISEARTVTRSAGVVAPLNRVIGDNDAPVGPPSGTITTKAVAASESPQAKDAFADHERAPEEADDEGLSEVERLQAEGKAQAEQLADDLELRREPRKRGGRSKKKGDEGAGGS